MRIMRAVMIFIEQLLCRSPMPRTLHTLSFNNYSTTVPATIVVSIKIKPSEIHTPSHGLNSTLSPGWENSLSQADP